MTVLSSGSIHRLIDSANLVEGYASIKDQLQPASFDFRLGESMRIAKTVMTHEWVHYAMGPPRLEPSGLLALDPFDKSRIEQTMEDLPMLRDTDGNGYWLLEPHAFCLAYTMEKVNIPANIGCQVSGRSSIGRLGLFVHITAGWVDPGFYGHVTLEIYNANPNPLIVRPGMKIGQFIFQKLDEECEAPYNGRYQNQPASPEISRFTH